LLLHLLSPLITLWPTWLHCFCLLQLPLMFFVTAVNCRHFCQCWLLLLFLAAGILSPLSWSVVAFIAAGLLLPTEDFFHLDIIKFGIAVTTECAIAQTAVTAFIGAVAVAVFCDRRLILAVFVATACCCQRLVAAGWLLPLLSPLFDCSLEIIFTLLLLLQSLSPLLLTHTAVSASVSTGCCLMLFWPQFDCCLFPIAGCCCCFSHSCRLIVQCWYWTMVTLSPLLKPLIFWCGNHLHSLRCYSHTVVFHSVTAGGLLLLGSFLSCCRARCSYCCYRCHHHCRLIETFILLLLWPMRCSRCSCRIRCWLLKLLPSPLSRTKRWSAMLLPPLSLWADRMIFCHPALLPAMHFCSSHQCFSLVVCRCCRCHCWWYHGCHSR